jgi:hypothetical protein
MDAKDQVLCSDTKTVINVSADDPTLDLPSKWRKAVQDLIAHLTAKGECYTSGVFSASMRHNRADAMVFSCPGVGELVKDLYYSGQLPSYADDGLGNGPVLPVMVPRVTEGLYPTRSPAGVEVFVYGPNEQACRDYQFEVFIPNPMKGETMASAPVPAVGQTALAVADKTGKTKTAVAIMGTRLTSMDIQAKVWVDGRLMIPRNAFEAAVHLGGTPLRGGDPVFVKIDTDKVTVTLASTGDLCEKPYDLTRDHGRIAITRDNVPFIPGQAFACTVAAGIVTVDITKPV